MHHHHDASPPKRGFLGSPTSFVLIAFLAIGAFFLWVEHKPHVLDALPYLLLLACPLLHLFMHGSHSGHGETGRGGKDPK